jgi:hypothetical protein
VRVDGEAVEMVLLYTGSAEPRALVSVEIELPTSRLLADSAKSFSNESGFSVPYLFDLYEALEGTIDWDKSAEQTIRIRA